MAERDTAAPRIAQAVDQAKELTSTVEGAASLRKQHEADFAAIDAKLVEAARGVAAMQAERSQLLSMTGSVDALKREVGAPSPRRNRHVTAT